MDPTIYALIKTSTFMVSSDPGNIPMYPQFATIQNIKMAARMWKNARNNYLSNMNISHVYFRMLDELFPNHF